MSVLVVAGCNSILSPTSEQTGVDGTTLSPAPVTDTPTETASSTPVVTAVSATSLPPGVEQNGTVDIERLLGAHNRLLANSSYTARIERTQRQGGPDGHIVFASARTYFVANESRFLVQNSVRNATKFVVSKTVYEQRERGGEVVTAVRERTARESVVRSRTLPQSLLPQNASGGAVTIRPVTRNGTTYYRIHATNPPASLTSTGQTIENYTATLFVRSDGLLRTLHLAYDGHSGSLRTRYRARITYRDVGKTTVPVPDWVQTIRENRTTTPTESQHN